MTDKDIIRLTVQKIISGEFSINDEEIKKSPFYEEILEEINKE